MKFPIPEHIFTHGEIERYFAGPKIICLICGREFHRLPTHVIRMHDMEIRDYKDRYGLPYTKPLISPSMHDKLRNSVAVQNAIAIAQANIQKTPQEVKGAKGKTKSVFRKNMMRELWKNVPR